ncbi:MAG: hypothetical protein ACREJ3_15640 [Polyangiaceae bacterium]
MAAARGIRLVDAIEQFHERVTPLSRIGATRPTNDKAAPGFGRDHPKGKARVLP